MRSLSIVIPAYNEERGIGPIIERALAVRPALSAMGVQMELLVVDDGSSDQTARIAETYDQVTLVRHRVNRGYGAALKTGFAAAKGDWVGFLDADGTYPPEHLPRLCDAMIAGADVVVGSRRSGSTSKMPLIRRVGNLLWSNLVTLLGNYRVDDPASGMRILRRSAFDKLYPLPDGLNFTPVMSTRASHEGLVVTEIPIPYEERDGDSKLSVARDGARFLRTIVWTSLNYNPVRLLGGLGLVVATVAAAIAMALIAMRLSGIASLGPWGVTVAYLASVMGLLGVNLIVLGITFNYLVALAHARPVHQGLFGKPLFRKPLDGHFWWLGGLCVGAGTALGGVSLVRALEGWPIDRLWLYLLAGSMLVLLGIQLAIFWIIFRVLDALSQREALKRADFEAAP